MTHQYTALLSAKSDDQWCSPTSSVTLIDLSPEERTDLCQVMGRDSTRNPDHLTAGTQGRRGERRGRRIEEEERSLSGELTDSSSSKKPSLMTNHNSWWEDEDTAAVMCVRLHQLKHQTADSLQLRQALTYTAEDVSAVEREHTTFKI